MRPSAMRPHGESDVDLDADLLDNRKTPTADIAGPRGLWERNVNSEVQDLSESQHQIDDGCSASLEVRLESAEVNRTIRMFCEPR